MFRKREEAEWSRLARALSNRGAEEGVEQEQGEGVVIDETPAAASPSTPTVPDVNVTIVRPRQVAEPASDEVETVIGERSTWEGTLRAEHSIRIKGKVEGDVETPRAVYIEEPAQVKARIAASVVVVAGQLEGAVNCTGRVELRSTGRVTGEVQAVVIVIQEGAYFDGSLRMTQPNRTPSG